jgi:PAS domain S-box-containing protein
LATLSDPPASVEDGGTAFFRALAENVPAIVFTTNPAADDVEYFNRRWYEYTGQTPAQARHGGHLTCVHPDDLGRLKGELGRIYASGCEGIAEGRYRRRDGAYRWHRITFAPYRDPAGRVERWLGTISDIHSERSAQGAFRAIADSVPVLAWSATADGRIDYLNARWAERIADPAVLSGGVARKIVHPDDLETVLSAWHRALETGHDFRYRHRIRMRDGEYRWHEATATAERDESGMVLRWYGAAIDIHDDVTLREALRDADMVTRLIRELAQRTPTLLFTAAPDGRIEFVNDRWTDVLGVEPQDLAGHGWTRVVHADDLPQIVTALRAHRRSGEPYLGEWRFKRSDRAYRWIEIRAEAQRDADGRIVRWYGAGIDIDRQRRAIDALDRLVERAVDTTASPDLDTTLSLIATASLAGIADISVFDLLDAQGSARRVVVGTPNVPAAETQAVSAFDIRRYGLAYPLADAIRERRSILIPVISDAFVESHVAGSERQAAWRASSARSMIITPIISGDAVLGALTLLRTLSGVPFDTRDVLVVEEIARRSAIAIENIRLVEIARAVVTERDERFRQIADATPQLIWVCDARGKVLWVNARWLQFTGQSFADALDEGWRTIVHPDDEDEAQRRWREAAANGEAYECEYRLRGQDGGFRWFLGRAIAVRTTDGTLWYGSNTDIDDARRAARTLRVFADIGEALSESLGLAATLDAVMRVVVPEYADWAFIALLDEAGDQRVAAVYHDDPLKSAALAATIGKIYARVRRENAAATAMRLREPLLFQHATYADGTANVEPEILNDFSRVAGYESVVVVPLIVGSTPRGTLTMCMSRHGRHFHSGDLPFFTELGRRIAPAIANAELYERERRVAQLFQEAALPAALPAANGYIFSAIYEAGRAEALVGGDWYDAFGLLDGRIVISIGDVAGSGLRAAVTMSNIRQAVRGVAHVHADCELMLEAADRALRTDIPDSFATAFVGVIDAVAGTLSYKSAGHPAALIRRPNGVIEELRTGGLPLGLRSADRSPPDVTRLDVGSSIYLYTDGLIESTHDMLAGERRLRDAIEHTHGVDPAERARAISGAVLVDGSRDDVAILCVSVVERRQPRRWTVDVRDVGATTRMRAEILAALDLRERAPLWNHAAELILAEIIGNLARYAPADVEFVLESEESRPVLHVLDNGPGFEFLPKLPPDLLAESGRGLFLISALAADFNVTRRAGRGSHLRVVFAA